MDITSSTADWIARTEWLPVGVCMEGEPIKVQNVNPWVHHGEWEPIGEVILYHPQYPQQKHRMCVYRLGSVVFATGELSKLVYGFFVPKASPASST